MVLIYWVNLEVVNNIYKLALSLNNMVAMQRESESSLSRDDVVRIDLNFFELVAFSGGHFSVTCDVMCGGSSCGNSCGRCGACSCACSCSCYLPSTNNDRAYFVTSADEKEPAPTRL